MRNKRIGIFYEHNTFLGQIAMVAGLICFLFSYAYSESSKDIFYFLEDDEISDEEGYFIFEMRHSLITIHDIHYHHNPTKSLVYIKAKINCVDEYYDEYDPENQVVKSHIMYSLKSRDEWKSVSMNHVEGSQWEAAIPLDTELIENDELVYFFYLIDKSNNIFTETPDSLEHESIDGILDNSFFEYRTEPIKKEYESYFLKSYGLMGKDGPVISFFVGGSVGL